METSEYLKNEIDRLNKTITLNYVISAILSLLILAYAVFGLWFLGEMTNPAKLSGYAVYKAQVNGPVAIKKLEALMEDKAPFVADGISRAVQKILPELRYSLQSQMDTMLTKNYQEIQSGMLDITNAWLDAHAAEIGTKRANETVAQYADRVVDALTVSFGKNLDDYMNDTMGISVDELNSRSEYMLGKLDSHLNTLNSTTDAKLTRSQKLERFLIGYVINTYLKDSSNR